MEPSRHAYLCFDAEQCSKQRASWVCDQEGNESGKSDSNTGKGSDGEWINDWKIRVARYALNQNIASGWHPRWGLFLLSQLLVSNPLNFESASGTSGPCNVRYPSVQGLTQLGATIR